MNIYYLKCQDIVQHIRTSNDLKLYKSRSISIIAAFIVWLLSYLILPSPK
jgi:hypothetical protein